MKLSRRDFLTAAGAGTVGALAEGAWGATQSTEPITSVDNPLKSYPNRDWEQVYHDIYAYDEVDWTVCHPNCTQSCALNFYMKNGVPIRAEQVYHNEEPSVGPSGYEDAGVSQHWNPRGCMKGLSLHRRTFEPSRIKYPMVRKGWDPEDPNPEGRGEDEFKRVSWDEAIDLIAEKMANLEDNKRFHIFNAIKADGLFTRHGSGRRLASIFGGCEWTEYDWYADLPPGHVITTGYQTSDSDAVAWRKADYTIIQGKNLIHNKLADNHFLQETRERGGKMVGVYPDYSPTVQKCDRWLPIRPGSDPAFALGMAHVIMAEELYDAEFMRKFTSLPLLIREDTGKYLRAHEVFEDVEPPAEDIDEQHEHNDWGDFVVLGEDGQPVAMTREEVGEEMPTTPQLDVDSEVALTDGSTVAVRSDFARQRDNIIENYDPETVEDITTIPADKLAQTAREFADAEKGQWFTGEGINHWFHSNDALQRAVFLVQAMLGNIGDAGQGYYNYSGQYKIELLDGYPHYVNPDGNAAHGMYPGYAFAFFGGEKLDPHEIRGDFDREMDLVPQGDAEEPVMPKNAGSYTMSKPSILWTMNCNLLNQTKHQEHVIENFVKHPDTENDLFIVSDMHMTYSARHADIVLPVPSWLECEYPDITIGPENPFVQMDHGVMDPIYDTKQDGEAVAMVAEKLDEKIPPEERNVDSYRAYFEEFLEEDGDVKNYIQETFDRGMTTQSIDVEDLEDGPERLDLKTYPRIPFYSQVHEDRPFYTKTGRMEFHKEEDRFIELGRDDIDHVESVEGTPYGVNKKWDEAKDEENPLYHDEGNQFYYNTPHPKYRTHSSWGMTDWNLIWASRDFGSVSGDPEGTDRLVDDFSFPTGDGESEDVAPLGEAFVEMHPSDAADIDVENGDYVRITGKRGDLVVRAMVSERQRPRSAGDMGQLTLWHGWWPQHFPDDEADEDGVKGYNTITNIWLDPLQETDDLVHKAVFGDPNVSDIYDEDGERVFPDREVNSVSVSMTHDERQFYRAVTDYVKNVYNRSEKLNEPAVGFAMALMQKRLVSSVGAIHATLRRRLDDLLDEEAETDGLSEEARAYLDGEDLDEDDKQHAEDEIAGLTVTSTDEQLQEEIETLRDLVSLAEDLPVDSKAQKVRRFISQLLEEQSDEKLLLFTEYRDTLDYLLEFVQDEPWADEILVIHGDVDKDERTRIEDEFNHGQSRLLFATDAASEGIDLQHSCHIMANYELPWNPNRLEQRIGRIHRYGQEEEVKVWNFLFDDTRESEIFEMLQTKVEEIRSQLGNTADVLGILDDIDVDSLIMESIENDEPPSATKAELEQLIEERQRTLEEWYERSLVDTSTFDAESRRQIQEVVDESADVYGSEGDIREFFERAVEAFGGEFEKRGTNLYQAELPDGINSPGQDATFGPFTFDRDFAMDHEDITYLAPDTDVLQRLMARVLEDERGAVGLKLLPFVDTPGITYNYRVAFEDGTGDVIREETIPVFVDATQGDAQQALGERVVEGDSVAAKPDVDDLRTVLDAQSDLRAAADRYVSVRVNEIKNHLQEKRHKETAQELENLEEYAQAERERIEAFIEEYERKSDAGSDMDIAIRGQQERLAQLEERIETRRRELERREQIISLAPEVENYCLTLPL